MQQQHHGKVISVAFDPFRDSEVSREARRDLQTTIAAIMRFSDGDWGDSSASMANDNSVQRKVDGAQVHGKYGNILVSAELTVVRGELHTSTILVQTAAEAKALPLPDRFMATAAG
ncbi:MAG: hypothetical protein HZA81_02090 [Candidatus Taylorbacteria bacterium]|nr:hypothetical protein [Candidatus Taylorbacteria bacterium]